MVSAVQKVVDQVRERVPALISLPLRRVDQRWLDLRWPVREFAAPPVGSGMSPILGDAGAPVVGHPLEGMRFGPEYSRRLYRECGQVPWQGAFGRKFVVLSGPDATQIAMVHKDKAISQEGWKFLMNITCTAGFCNSRLPATGWLATSVSSVRPCGTEWRLGRGSPTRGSAGPSSTWPSMLRRHHSWVRRAAP